MGETRRLIQDGSGTIYVWSEALAKRKDMTLLRDGVRVGMAVPEDARVKRVPIELQGKSFMVEQDLHDVLSEMVDVMVGLQAENASLKAAADDFEAFKERLTTDNLDLAEQLAAATTNQGTEAATEAEPTPKKKGK